MEFNIGSRIKVKQWHEISEDKKVKNTEGNPHMWTPGKAKSCGLVGTIVDKIYSEAYDCFTYSILFDGQDYPSRSQFDSDSLVPFEDIKAEWHYEFEIVNDLVIAILYETKDGVTTEVERGHGHIIHEGIKGFAQASSYALKKIYEHINGGTL